MNTREKIEIMKRFLKGDLIEVSVDNGKTWTALFG